MAEINNTTIDSASFVDQQSRLARDQQSRLARDQQSRLARDQVTRANKEPPIDGTSENMKLSYAQIATLDNKSINTYETHETADGVQVTAPTKPYHDENVIIPPKVSFSNQHRLRSGKIDGLFNWCGSCPPIPHEVKLRYIEKESVSKLEQGHCDCVLVSTDKTEMWWCGEVEKCNPANFKERQFGAAYEIVDNVHSIVATQSHDLNEETKKKDVLYAANQKLRVGHNCMNTIELEGNICAYTWCGLDICVSPIRYNSDGYEMDGVCW